jgi:hypothetical protein
MPEHGCLSWFATTGFPSITLYQFNMVNFQAIIDEMTEIDWIQLFACMSVDCCVAMCYDEIWKHFEKVVPMNFHGTRLSWISHEMRSLKTGRHS